MANFGRILAEKAWTALPNGPFGRTLVSKMAGCGICNKTGNDAHPTCPFKPVGAPLRKRERDLFPTAMPFLGSFAIHFLSFPPSLLLSFSFGLWRPTEGSHRRRFDNDKRRNRPLAIVSLVANVDAASVRELNLPHLPVCPFLRTNCDRH